MPWYLFVMVFLGSILVAWYRGRRAERAVREVGSGGSAAFRVQAVVEGAPDDRDPVPGDLVVTRTGAWWFDAGAPGGVALPGLRVAGMHERAEGGVSRVFADQSLTELTLVTSTGIALLVTVPVEQALTITDALARVAEADAGAADPAPAVHWTGWRPPGWAAASAAAALAVVGGFLALLALGNHTQGTVVSVNANDESTVTWTDPRTGEQRSDRVDPHSYEGPDAVGSQVPITVLPRPLDGQAWNQESATIGAGLLAGAFALAALVGAVIGVVRWRRSRRAAATGGLLAGAVPTREARSPEVDARIELPGYSATRWSTVVPYLAARAADEQWDRTPGALPTRTVMVRAGLLRLIWPLIVLGVGGWFALEAWQTALALDAGPTTSVTATVQTVDGFPLLDSCLLTWPGAGEQYLASAPCGGVDEGSTVRAQVLVDPQPTVMGYSPARLLDGGDTMTRTLVLTSVVFLVGLGMLAWRIWTGLLPLRRMGQLVAAGTGVDLRYARGRDGFGSDYLVLFPLYGDPEPRWAIDLPGELPPSIALSGALRLAGPTTPDGLSPVDGQMSIPVVAGTPLWPQAPVLAVTAQEVRATIAAPADFADEYLTDD